MTRCSRARRTWAPTTPTLVQNIKQRQAQIAAFDHVKVSAIPPDAVTTSGSGLDPYVSPANAAIQVDRVAAARHISPAQVRALVSKYTQGRTIGFLGRAESERAAAEHRPDEHTRLMLIATAQSAMHAAALLASYRRGRASAAPGAADQPARPRIRGHHLDRGRAGPGRGGPASPGRCAPRPGAARPGRDRCHPRAQGLDWSPRPGAVRPDRLGRQDRRAGRRRRRLRHQAVLDGGTGRPVARAAPPGRPPVQPSGLQPRPVHDRPGRPDRRAARTGPGEVADGAEAAR